MDYSLAIEKRDIAKIDKLNNLCDIETYWDDVRKLTRNVTSDHIIGRWQCLAEARFVEIQQKAVENYHYFRNALCSEVSGSTMDLIDLWILDQGRLPTYDMGSYDIENAKYLKKMYKILKSHGLI